MKILGLGDNVFDIYDNLHISYPGGNAVNVACNASKLGHQASYLGNIADDKYGHHMVQTLRSYHVDISHCPIIKNTTTKCCLQNIYDGERQFLKVELGDNWCQPIQLQPIYSSYFDKFDVIFTSCNAKIEQSLFYLKDTKAFVSYDFGEKEKYRTPEYFSKVLPYIDFAQFSFNNMEEDYLKEFVEKNNIEIPVLVTRGDKDPLLYVRGKIFKGHNQYVTPVDTMGAGDGFISALVCYLVEHGLKKNTKIEEMIFEDALFFAGKYASEVVKIHGGIGYPMKEKKHKAVIFDMDGVIVDTEHYWLSLFRMIAADENKVLKKEDEKEFYGCSLEHEPVILKRYLDWDTERIVARKKELMTKMPIDYAKNVMPGVVDFIKYLKNSGYQLAIASSSYQKDILRMIKENHLEDIFDVIVSGEMFENSKPNPQIYNYTVQKMNVDKNDILVIEDSEYGILAALNASLDVMMLRNEMYDYVNHNIYMAFDSYEETKEYFKEVLDSE